MTKSQGKETNYEMLETDQRLIGPGVKPQIWVQRTMPSLGSGSFSH